MLNSSDDYFQSLNNNIYISAQLLPEQLKALLDRGIKSVLCLRCAEESGFRAEEKAQVEERGIIYRHNPVSAETLSYEGITQILREIDQLPKPVLIGCRSAFRSGFIAMLYLSTRGQLTVWETLSLQQRLGFDFSTKPLFQQWFERYIRQYSVG